ncbi:uncharacterized protein METZ01_LOCUS79138, partial [marine metagenome]
VQDLRKEDQDFSLHDDFVYCWLPPEQLVKNGFSSNIPLHDTLITCSGVFSIKNKELQITGPYERKRGSIATAGYFVALDIKSVLSKYKKWFMTNLLFKLHDNIYPMPLGVFRKEIANFTPLRKGDKEHFCYANFSMTWSYRLNVAEWANAQKYIRCYFPKRFSVLDQDLDDTILSNNPLPFNEFLETLASHKFCIAPNGVGIDTDRLWECIFLNTVPIVQNNYGNRVFSKIWPMILVDRYEFADIPKLAEEFETQHGECIQYNHDLLLRKNLPELLDRIEYECKRLDE